MSDEQPALRIVTVDDEPLGLATLRGLLARDSEVLLVEECANGAEAIAAVRKQKPDIVFLDVQMPGMTGFDVVDVLAEGDLPIVVFVTAFDQYALKAFDVNAVDYLLKPFDDERFESALKRAKERARGAGLARVQEQLASALETVRNSEGRERQRISVRSEGRVQLVDVDDITWIESADQYVQIHTTSEMFLMRESMATLERDLDADCFMRIHRSAIVAIDQIKQLESLPGGGARVQIDAETWLPVSRSRVAGVRARLK